jgi:hypothetical protein
MEKRKKKLGGGAAATPTATPKNARQEKSA